MAGSLADDGRERIRVYRLGRRLLKSASVLSPCAALIDPLLRKVERPRELVARRDAALLGWLMRLGENINRTRTMSPPHYARHLEKKNTSAEPSHAYLVKQGSLLPAPSAAAGMQCADAGEAIRSMSNAPKNDHRSANT